MASRPSDEAMSRALNQMGIATLEQIEAAQREQTAAAQTGQIISLGDVLIKQGVITAATRDNIEKKLMAQQQGGLQQLGNYKLIKKLGEGGMGAVYLAEDVTMMRKVALKVLPKRYASDPQFLQRFRREAKAAGKLNHVNIISAFTVGEELGNHFYVMEFCEGEPLDKQLKREQFLPWDRAIEIAIQVARGLKHAHEHSIIHRDIKPANIFMASGNIAKILDMGLSKDIGSTEQSFNTQTGVALGTPHYISPEQAKGEKNVDGRTDIYSLGATLYHLVTGRTPFDGSTAAMVIMKHLTEQLPNPQDIREDIPDGVVQIIQKMMAKDSADRYADCDELLADLELVIDGKSPSSLAIDVGKSSIAIRRASLPQAREKPGSAPRRVGTQSGVPEKRKSAAMLIGIAACVLGGSILIYALSTNSGRGPISPKGGESAVTDTKSNPPNTTPRPAPAVQQVKAENVRAGLWATYWSGDDAKNVFKKFHFAREETKLSQNFQFGSPGNGMPADYFGVKLNGFLDINEAGTYVLKLNSDDTLSITIDEKFVANSNSGLEAVCECKLERGLHAISIIYTEELGTASWSLQWRRPGSLTWQDIPPEVVVHSAEQEDAPKAQPAKTTAITQASGTVDFAVQANKDWQDSGVVVKKGQWLSITADGKWRGGREADDETGPAGTTKLKVNGQLWMALMARVGDEAGGVIGAAWDGSTSGAGHVFFKANDNYLDDNAGFVTAHIVVKPIDDAPKIVTKPDPLPVAPPATPEKPTAEWISKDATYTVSSTQSGNWQKPSLLSGVGGGWSANGIVEQNWEFAFSTKEEPNPFIVIDLGKPFRIDSLQIANRKGVAWVQERAKTLTAWAGESAGGPWEEFWRADGAKPEWIVNPQRPLETRFIKLGLRETNLLHLLSVKVFGQNSVVPVTEPPVAWISKDATYTVSSSQLEFKKRPSLLSCEGGGWTSYGGVPQNWEFAFHTRLEQNPYIVIDLGKLFQIDSIEIVNRKGNEFQTRAKTLTAWSGAGEKGPWEEFWRTDDARPEWRAKAEKPLETRFIKLGLREKECFHLYSVKVYGKPAGPRTNK